MIKKILVSQPKPSSEKSPYFDIANRFGVELVFRPFIKVEAITSKDFRAQKVSIPFSPHVMPSTTSSIWPRN